MQIDHELVESVRSTVNAISFRDWSALEKISPNSRLAQDDVERVLDDYEHTFERLPLRFYEEMNVINSDAGEVYIDCPFWTAEEGRSDLEVRMVCTVKDGGRWDVVVEDVLVP